MKSEIKQLENRILLLKLEEEGTRRDIAGARRQAKKLKSIQKVKEKRYEQKISIITHKEQSEETRKATTQKLKDSLKKGLENSKYKLLTQNSEQAAKLRIQEKRLLQNSKKTLEKGISEKKFSVQSLSKIKTVSNKPNNLSKDGNKKILKEEKRIIIGKERLKKLGELELILIQKAKGTLKAQERELAKLRIETQKPPSNYQKYKEKLEDLKRSLYWSPKNTISVTSLSAHFRSPTFG